MNPSRRTVLGALCMPATVLSGWKAAAMRGSKPSITPDDPDETRHETVGRSIHTTLEIESGHYRCWTVSLNPEIVSDSDTKTTVYLEYTVTVHSGPPVDVFVLTRAEMQRLKAKAAFQYLPAYSQLDTRKAAVSAPLDLNEFVLVIDNTTRGDATQWLDGTPRPVTASLDLTTTQR